ncbi:hypothetical protein [Streptococcus mutans]
MIISKKLTKLLLGLTFAGIIGSYYRNVGWVYSSVGPWQTY